MESTEVMENTDKQEFLDTVDSKMAVKVNYEKKDVDYEWLTQIEDTIKYIDNIVRNPKRFIVNEEEIVKIEQSRKVTVESVIHLTQHTNLIQKIDENGDVKPSKILNINKEESLDTYENRFVYTLIKQINHIMTEHEADINAKSYVHDEKEINYDANTKINKELVNISVKLKSSNNIDGVENITNGMTIEERFKKVKVQLSGILNSELYQTLTKLHVSEVRPPIRKTNVILKNPNFQRANELFNFFQNYDDKNFVVVKNNEDYMETGELKDKFDESFFLNYMVLDSLSVDKSKKSYNNFMSMTINKIIEYVLEENEDMTKKDFNEIVSKEFAKAKQKIEYRDGIIENVFNTKFNQVEAKVNEILDILD